MSDVHGEYNVQGFQAKYVIDHTETFSPVVRYVVLHMVGVRLAKYFGCPVDRLGVVTTSLYGVMK